MFKGSTWKINLKCLREIKNIKLMEIYTMLMDWSFNIFVILLEMVYATAAKLLQSCPTLCNFIDGSPPGSPIPGILQARTLEWVAISFSSAWKWKVKVKSLSRVWLLETSWTAAYQAPTSMGFSRQEYWSGLPLPSPKMVYRYIQNNFSQNFSIYFVENSKLFLKYIWKIKTFPLGEGNGSPLQCSCLENPRDGGAWWAAVYGVAQSRTRLKRLSSSSSSSLLTNIFIFSSF